MNGMKNQNEVLLYLYFSDNDVKKWGSFKRKCHRLSVILDRRLMTHQRNNAGITKEQDSACVPMSQQTERK